MDSQQDFSLWQPEEVALGLAERSRALRLSRGWKQLTLAERSGVSLASLRRFERTGLASLQTVLAIAFSLGRLEEFTQLLQPLKARSLEELKKQDQKKKPKRGRR